MQRLPTLPKIPRIPKIPGGAKVPAKKNEAKEEVAKQENGEKKSKTE